jgi:AsmA family protein
MTLFRTLLKVLAGIVVLALLAAAIFLATFDANKYRPLVAETLTRQLGRDVKLDGPVSLGLSISQGLNLSVRDVSVASASWASRQPMAKIGEIKLGVALPPLLQHKLDVTSFTLKNADIQLEKNAAGQTNWTFAPKTPSAPAPAQPAAAAKESKALSFSINRVDIENAQMSYRDAGKITALNVKKLTYMPANNGMDVSFEGEVNGAPVTIAMQAETSLDRLMDSKWPFTASLHYAPYDLQMQGVANPAASEIVLSPAALTAGKTKIVNQVTIAYGGARPVVKGTVTSDRLDPADLKPAPSTEAEKPKGEASGSGGQARIFSAEPLQLDGLKAADAMLDIAIGEIPVGESSLKDVKAKVDLQNGRLLLSPVSMQTAGSKIEGQVKLDAEKNPVQFGSILKAYHLDLAQFVSLSGLKSFLESKGDADMDVTTFGNSLHDFASNANGEINLIMAGGSVSKQTLGDVADGLLNIFAPGTGQLAKPDLNCFVAHFKITNGQMESKGLLLDAGQATVAGSGGVNLRDETIDMLLRTRTKVLAEANALTPPLRIRGPLAKPSFTPDAAASAQKIVGALTGGSLGDGGVPEVVKQAGQNACQYTLEHPQAPKPEALPAPVEKAVEKAREKVKDLGGKLLNGIGGGLFGK